MYPILLETLIQQFTKLPGIGQRSAERIALWVLNQDKHEALELAHSIVKLKEGLRFCQRCNNFSEADQCRVCLNPTRDRKTICVVEEPKDLIAIERSGSYQGVYHVLLGTIAPAEGRGPEDIKCDQLIRRVQAEGTQEVVIATDPDNEGEMTAMYLVKHLKPLGVRVSRIALGIPVGSSVEFADMSTLSMSLISRREIEN